MTAPTHALYYVSHDGKRRIRIDDITSSDEILISERVDPPGEWRSAGRISQGELARGYVVTTEPYPEAHR